MNILLNFGRKTSIMEKKQCLVCNEGFDEEKLYLIEEMHGRMLFSSDKKKAMSMAIRSGNTEIILFLKNAGFPFDHLIDEFEYLRQYQIRMLLDL